MNEPMSYLEIGPRMCVTDATAVLLWHKLK
jgi:hypothetical protein